MILRRQFSCLIGIVTVGLIILCLIALHTLRSNIIDGHKQEIIQILSFARNIAAKYVAEEQQGLLTKEKAEEKVIEILSGMRSGSSYVWANDHNNIARVHYLQKRLGTLQTSTPRLLKEVQASDTGYVFNTHMNVKPGSSVDVLKINGTTLLPGWNWVLGIGVYMDEINQLYWDFAIKFIVFGLLILIVISGMSMFIISTILRKLGGELNYTTEVTQSIAAGNLSTHIDGNFNDESLLGSISRMQAALKQIMSENERLMNTDELTLVMNRRSFDDYCSEIISNSRDANEIIAFLLLDIDYFKQFNDCYGHCEGDKALKAVGRVINQSLRRKEDACFRLGGEEFCIIFQIDNINRAEEFGKLIKDKIEALKIPHQKNTASPFLTASIGLAFGKITGNKKMEEIYCLADELLYKAKAKGRNTIVSQRFDLNQHNPEFSFDDE